MLSIKHLKLFIFFLFCIGGMGLLLTGNLARRAASARSTGPDAGFTNAPGELNCDDCHVPDAGGGRTGQFAILAPQNYVPGQSYQITVRHTSDDATRLRWGFQLTALDDNNSKAGELSSLDALTQALNNQGSFPDRQYIEHTSEGTFTGQQGGASWTFRWTAPPVDVGPVSFYAAGNQANGDFNTSGDNIYFTFIAATPAEAASDIDDAGFFVRQHYADFLNRQPDEAGLNFWTGQINSCGTDAACRDLRRSNVSAAFFLSVEFQQTGYLVYRLYEAAFDRQPRFHEFIPDTREISRDIVDGQDGWEQRLEANKQSFIGGWVERPAFKAAFDSLTDAQYVDKLFANASITNEFDRNALALALGGGTETRASVLRKIAESETLKRSEFNRAFVLMQYFGYLRRNPDDAPDNNLNGYNFWLGKLNQFGGNYIEAEMVEAFITSDEYRGRFRP